MLRSGRKHSGSLAVLHLSRTQSAARFGIAVGRRSAKSAVVRNSIKRRARELFRRHALKRARFDVVVTLTPRFQPNAVEPLMIELAQLMDRANESS
jgi:ribonuclease P protein component